LRASPPARGKVFARAKVPARRRGAARRRAGLRDPGAERRGGQQGRHRAHDRTRSQGGWRTDPRAARRRPDRVDADRFHRLCAFRQRADPASLGTRHRHRAAVSARAVEPADHGQRQQHHRHRLLPPHDARVHFDGQTRFDARAGDVVRMRARATTSPCCIRRATAISPCCARSCTGVRRPVTDCPWKHAAASDHPRFRHCRPLELEFGGGFGALTGETGAGKSILVDALSLALGERADAAVVRSGAERAEISAEFDVRRRGRWKPGCGPTTSIPMPACCAA
jgi:hypothetical protein